ncbi:hypothetical protein RNJ44_02791 [Nakaseomyces bracarensis]|uniref:Tr-type G domain-containing protein n=1 Tax=Nakaseomyces bracarensis TaxID=273131 RepID=A0ABR4P087_9SACH
MSKLEELARQRRLKRAEVNGETNSTTVKSASLLEKLKSKKSESTTNVSKIEIKKPHVNGVKKNTSSLGSKLQELRNRNKPEVKSSKESISIDKGKKKESSRNQKEEAIIWSEFEQLLHTKRNYDDVDSEYELVSSTEFIMEHIQKRKRLPILDKNPRIYTVFYPSTHFEAEARSNRNFQNPSPDDVILEAQEQVFKDVSSNVAQLTLEETKKKKKSKNHAKVEKYIEPMLMSVEDLKTDHNIFPFNIYILGDKGCGKSTILGNISYTLGLTSIEKLRDIKKEIELMHHRRIDKLDTRLLHQSPFSWIIDKSEDERRSGKSLGIKSLDIRYNDYNMSLYEIPSSVSPIKAVDALKSKPAYAMIVVSASTNEYEESMNINSELRQKLLTLRGLGVSHFTTVVNKMDTIDWDPERFFNIKNELSIVYKNLGFDLENIAWNVLSAITEDGMANRISRNVNAAIRNISKVSLLDALINARLKQNSKTVTLLESQTSDILSSQTTEFLMNPIIFDKKNDSLISGYIDNGVLQPGEQLKLLTSNKKVTIQSIKLKNGRNSTRYKSKAAFRGNWYNLSIISNEEINEHDDFALVPAIKSTIKLYFNFLLKFYSHAYNDSNHNNGIYKIYCNGALFQMELTDLTINNLDDYIVQVQCKGNVIDDSLMLGFDRDIPISKSVLVFSEDRLLGFGEILPLQD